MQSIAKIYENQSSERFFGSARIVRYDDNHELVHISFTDKHIRKETTARVAISSGVSFCEGDDALVVEDNEGNFYIIGVLAQKQKVEDSIPHITLPDGTRASINDSANGQKLCVYTNNNYLLFEYDSGTKQARIFTEAENTTFDAPKGNIAFNAAGNILLNGNQVQVAGRDGIGLFVGHIVEELKSKMLLRPGKMDISANELKISGRRASLFLKEARNHVKMAVIKIETLKLLTGRIESTAGTIIEKVKNVYRSIEETNQVKAGRMRMLVQKTFHLKSKTSVIKAEDDVKVKGEKIHLG